MENKNKIHLLSEAEFIFLRSYKLNAVKYVLILNFPFIVSTAVEIIYSIDSLKEKLT